MVSDVGFIVKDVNNMSLSLITTGIQVLLAMNTKHKIIVKVVNEKRKEWLTV